MKLIKYVRTFIAEQLFTRFDIAWPGGERKEIYCPRCKQQHLDMGWFFFYPHSEHQCDNTPRGPAMGCGLRWRPFTHHTTGVDEP